MKKVILYAIAGALGIFVTAANAIPREDVLECALPGGGRAILTAEYDWSLLAEVIPADLSKRLNQEPWQIVFDTKESRAAQRPPRSVSHVHGSKPPLAQPFQGRTVRLNGKPVPTVPEG